MRTGWIASDITLVKKELIWEENYLPDQSMSLVALSEHTVKVLLAKIHLEWEDLRGDMTVEVREHLPADVLIGSDIVVATSNVNVITRSQRKYGSDMDTVTCDSDGICEQTKDISRLVPVETVAEVALNLGEIQKKFY